MAAPPAARVLLSLCLALLPATAAVAATDSVGSVRVSGSPFSPDGDGIRDTARLSIELRGAVTLRVTVADFDGVVRRTLLQPVERDAGTLRLNWDGRNDVGRLVPDGPYVFRVTAQDAGGSVTVERGVTKARYRVYPPRPGAITVALDPGHGGSYDGAVVDGYREADFNLDIGLRLASMLRAAGVTVVMTRTTDTDVNVPAWDRNGDGETGYRDELAARVDTANLARADLFISIHNNIAVDRRVGGPSTFTNGDRSWSRHGFRLAGLLQDEIVAELRRYRTDSWSPYDHGVLTHPYYVMRPYELPLIPRPSLMPTILGESLFLSHPDELPLLRTPRVRGSIAVAYYNAVARYIAGRAYSVRYIPRLGPASAAPGEAVSYRVLVRNRGYRVLSGAGLELRSVAAVTLYDGSESAGALLGRVSLPTLGPGEGTAVELTITAPEDDIDLILKTDIRLGDGRYLSLRGVPPLQLPLRVGAGSPPPSPSPSPSPGPSASASAPAGE